MDWDAITPKLNARLDPKHVKAPPAGKYGEYVEGWHVVAEANRVFGFGGWSYRIERLDECNRELVWLESRNGEKYQQWRVCHVCSVTVTVGEASRQDIGTGQGQAKPNALGDAIDSSAKEAVTDALKRALRTFGNIFGLALYDKTKANVGVDDAPVAEPPAPKQQPAQEKPAAPTQKAATPADPKPTERTLTKNEGEALLAAIAERHDWRELDEYIHALSRGPMAFAANHPKIKTAVAEKRASFSQTPTAPADNPFAGEELPY